MGCRTVLPEPRVGGVRVGGVRVVAGRVGADGWVGGWARGNAVCSRIYVVVVVVVLVVDVLGMLVAFMYVRSHVAGGVLCMGPYFCL